MENVKKYNTECRLHIPISKDLKNMAKAKAILEGKTFSKWVSDLISSSLKINNKEVK